MTDFSSIASMATAGGTLVLAVATFASVRSGNRSARIAEQALLDQLRPVLVQSRLDDRDEKIFWGDRHGAYLHGGHGVVELAGDIVYLAMSLRNVGSGMAVIQAWLPVADFVPNEDPRERLDEFRRQGRDLYIPPSDMSFWQGALRDPDEAVWQPIADAVRQREPLSIYVLYSDHDGGQRAISRFQLIPRGEESVDWLCSVNRHWNIDRDDPRDLA